MPPRNLSKLGASNLGSGNASSPGRNALGKGLNALIPGKTSSRKEYFECPLDRILPTQDQPRRTFDHEAIKELAESIRVSGLIQPLVVRQDGTHFRLIAGERRFRAARSLKLERVPVVIKDVDESEAYELALVENIQRQDLNPLEEAEAYKRLMDMRNYTQEALAQRIGRSRPAIANTLRLLKLDASLRDMVINGELTEGAARSLLALPNKAQRTLVADAVRDHNLSVRQIESIARSVKQGADPEDAIQAEVNPETAEPEQTTLDAPAQGDAAADAEAAPTDAAPEANAEGAASAAPTTLDAAPADPSPDAAPQQATAASALAVTPEPPAPSILDIRQVAADVERAHGFQIDSGVKDGLATVTFITDDVQRLARLLQRLL